MQRKYLHIHYQEKPSLNYKMLKSCPIIVLHQDAIIKFSINKEFRKEENSLVLIKSTFTEEIFHGEFIL